MGCGLYLKIGPGPGGGPSEKPDPGPLEKADLITKFTVWVKDSFLRNLRVMISDTVIAFSNSSQSNAFFGPKFRHFFSQWNVVIRQIQGCWF